MAEAYVIAGMLVLAAVAVIAAAVLYTLQIRLERRHHEREVRRLVDRIGRLSGGRRVPGSLSVVEAKGRVSVVESRAMSELPVLPRSLRGAQLMAVDATDGGLAVVLELLEDYTTHDGERFTAGQCFKAPLKIKPGWKPPVEN